MLVGLCTVLVCRLAALAWLATFSSLVTQTAGQALYTLEQNEEAGMGIYVGIFQARLGTLNGI